MIAGIIALFFAAITTMITLAGITKDYKARKGPSTRQYTHLLPNTCYTHRMATMWTCGGLWAISGVAVAQEYCPEQVETMLYAMIGMCVLCFFGILWLKHRFRGQWKCGVCGAEKGYPCDPSKHC